MTSDDAGASTRQRPHSIRLFADDRARIPFAVVAALLLVTSGTMVATLHQYDRPDPGTSDAAVAVERTNAETTTAIRGAVAEASRDAAGSPVVEPIDGPFGAVLDDGDDPFVRYLELRIYVAVREALESVQREEGLYRTNVSVTDAETPDELRSALENVSVKPTESDGSGSIGSDEVLRVSIENVTLTLTRDGNVVDRRVETVDVVVPTPALALHERVDEYDRRLDRGPLEGPGLGRDLTARLYAVGWARGYAQYGGAPIQQVIANRHVELMTNGAILDVQEETLGASDPAGRDAVTRGSLRVGTTDLLAPTELDEERWAEVVSETDAIAGRDATVERPDSPAVEADDPLRVGVNESADRAFAAFVGDRPGTTKADVIDGVYAADAAIVTAVSGTADPDPPSPNEPSGDWTLVDEQREYTTSVSEGPARTPSVENGWERVETAHRTVARTVEVERVWRAENGTETAVTAANRTATARVGIAVAVEYSPSDHAPRRGIDGVGERGGPLNGPNLAEVEDRAIDQLVDDRGGMDVLAVDAVGGDLDGSMARIDADRPDGLEPWLYDDLVAVREEVRNVSVAIPRGKLATGEADPAGGLADELQDRREGIVDPPGATDRYDAAATKARTAARAAYLDVVIADLERQAAAGETTTDGIDDELDEDGASELVAVGQERPKPDRFPATEGRSIEVETDPTYLSLDARTGDEIGTVPDDREYYPLTARTTNVFTVPYGDVAEGIVERLLGSDPGIDLETAALTLRAADRTAEATNDPDAVDRRDDLESEVARSVEEVRHSFHRDLGVTTSMTDADRRLAIEEGYDRWDGTADRALATTNGSVADAVADAAAERGDLDERERDLVAVRLRVTAIDTRESTRVRPSTSTVNHTASEVREYKRDEVTDLAEAGAENLTERAADRWIGDSVVRVPAGLPLTPVPGYWYATANVWHVEVRGEHARFAVRSDYGGPDGGEVRYVRDGRAVEVDVTGDGEVEHLGYASRLSFDLRTTVIVVVPPGGTGIGDRDGRAIDESDGWPDPG